MTQQDGDRLVVLRKAEKKLIGQGQAAPGTGRHIAGNLRTKGLLHHRRLKQARLVGVRRYRPPVPFQKETTHSHVLSGGIVAYEAGGQLAGRVVDHVDQILLLAAPFQPVVSAGAPLNQFSPAIRRSLH